MLLHCRSIEDIPAMLDAASKRLMQLAIACDNEWDSQALAIESANMRRA